MRVGSSPTGPTVLLVILLKIPGIFFRFRGFFVYLQCYNVENMKNTGVKAAGIIAPFVREGDDIIKIATDAIIEATEDGKEIKDKDVYGITESVVARSAGLYVTVDDIAEDIRKKFGEGATVCLTNMIYSRNRFGIVLKGIARGAKKLILVMEAQDEVGNPRGVNPFTGVDIEEYYKELIKGEGCEVEVLYRLRTIWNDNPNLIYPGVDYVKDRIDGFIDCSLHPVGISGLSLHSWYCFHPAYLLSDICADYNPDFGLLGCNKSTEERIKLFPTKKLAADVCTGVRIAIKEKTGKDVIVMCYGDGCFHAPNIPGVPYSSINEFADPVSYLSDEYGMEILNSTPNEVKLKALIDNSADDEEIREVLGENKGKDLKGNMTSMGTTPRRFGDLLASLMDLTSGSGSRCTPFIRVEEYF